MFALWTWTGSAPGPAPAGDRETLSFAVPTGPGGAIEVTDVGCALVDSDELLNLNLGDAGASVHAWRAVLLDAAEICDARPRASRRPTSAQIHPEAASDQAGGISPPRIPARFESVSGPGDTPLLPIAAHAVPDAGGTSIVPAERAVRVLRETRCVGADL